MTKGKQKYSLEDLIDKVKTYINSDEDIAIIEKAYYFAKNKHEGQIRYSGEEYINHPLATAIILTSVYADTATICAGILHDTLEDTDTTRQELEQEFGKEIANLVYGVSKISRINCSTENDALVEYYKKIIVGMSEDVRVIIIKLADRLHNMRTLWALPIEKRKKKAKETLEILAPIAHHLGINKIKSELEDLSLRYLKPDVFYDIAEKLNNTKLERDNVVAEMLTSVSNILTEHGIKHEIKGRSKSIYSIYKKLEKGRKFSDIYDLLALRILVETEQECYTIIGLIHSKYKPIPKRFKDYIAMPKENGYQSLHTTVFGIDGYLFEIQIRTYAMDEVAENGVASHWAYKEHKDLTKASRNATESKLQFFRAIIELNEDKMSTEDFVNSVKNEVLSDSIYVFSPKGDVFELPKGSTPIDFAYRVHTKIGESMIGAIVNNNIVPLDYELQDNDIVKINTSKNSSGPSKEWLNIAKSTQTKNKIRSFFTKNEKNTYIEKGKELLEKELRKKKIPFNDFLSDNNVDIILDAIKEDNLNDLYYVIGSNKFSANYIVNIIDKEDKEEKEIKLKPIPKNTDADIIVDGIDKIKVNLANCCNPIPGDDIIGYITKGNGISIHRKNCPNLDNMEDRIVTVNWNDTIKNKYLATIIIYSKPYNNALLEIMQKASNSNISIDSMKTINKTDDVLYEIDIWVNNLEHLNNFIRDLNNFSYIDSVERLIK